MGLKERQYASVGKYREINSPLMDTKSGGKSKNKAQKSYEGTMTDSDAVPSYVVNSPKYEGST